MRWDTYIHPVILDIIVLTYTLLCVNIVHKLHFDKVLFYKGAITLKKRFVSVLLAALICFSAFAVFDCSHPDVAAAAFPNILDYSANSSSAGFTISSYAGMVAFSSLAGTTNFKGKTIYLECDIDMAEGKWTPFTSFAGTFDGQGHVLKNITVSVSQDCAGLFAKTTSTAHIKDLGIVGGTMTLAADTDSQRLGSFVGQMSGGTIERCYSTTTLVGKKYASTSTSDISVGGIVGANINGGVIKDCFYAGTATGVDHVSAISDWAQGQNAGSVGKLINCLSFAKLSATTCYGLARYSASILEENKASAVTNCFYVGSYTGLDFTTGDTKAGSYRLGSGNLAYLLNDSGAKKVWRQGALCPELTPNKGGVYKLTINYVAAGVTTTETVYMNAGDKYTPKGVTATLSSAGNVSGGVFTMPAANATLTVTTSTPNIINYDTNSSATTFVVTTAAGFTKMASLVNGGKTLSGVSIYMLNDINMSSVTNHTPIGTFISDSDYSKAFQGKLYGNNYKVIYLRVDQSALNGAGLFGVAYNASFDGVGIYGGTVKSANRAGGIAGYGDKCTFKNCYNTANITTLTGEDGVGGLTGVSRSGSKFTNCFNLGTVTATANCAGGLSGWGQTSVVLKNCFNLGTVTASNKQALSRYNGSLTNVPSASYYLSAACATSGYGTALSAGEFKNGTAAWLLNTAGGTASNSGVFTTTPIGPAICGQNDTPTVKLTVKGYDESERLLDVSTLYANGGDSVGISGSAASAHLAKAVTAPAKDGELTASVSAPTLKTLVIGTAAQLSAFATAVNGGTSYKGYYVYLTADIDMSSATKAVIGTESKPFRGVFDGCGKKITGFNAGSSAKYQGLFGCINYGVVQNLYLEGSTITGGSYSGTIVGKNAGGAVVNCGTNSNAVGYYTDASRQISVMSFNIRVPNDASPNSLSNRTPRVKQHLNDYSPDIIGFQEVTSAWKSVIDSHLSGYSKEFVWRDSNASSEAAPLYWRTSAFTVLEQGSFWLSSTPDKMSKDWDAGCYRTCSYAALIHKTSGTLVLAFNSHFDHQSATAREKSALLVSKRMKALQKKYTEKGYGENILTFCTGDYNCTPSSTAYKNMAASFTDMRSVADSLGCDEKQITFQGFGSSSGSIIDYIFIDPRGANSVSFKVCAEKVSGGYISDHYTLYGVFGLEAQSVGGIVGYNTGYISDCYTLGTVKKSINAGGIVGVNKGTIKNCYSGKALSATDYMGGIAGEQLGYISNCYYLTSTSYKAFANESATTGVKTEAQIKSADMASLLGSAWSYNASLNGGYPYPIAIFELTTLVIKASSAYTRTENALYEIKVKTEISALSSNFENVNLKFYDLSGTEIASGAYAGTGTTVSVVVGGTVTDSATVVVLGDINGDAMHSALDYIAMSASLKKQMTLSGAPLLAADMDKDGNCNAVDYIALKNLLTY